MRMPPIYKIGLVLSGGGARGIAHIGALKALEENGIHPEVLSGASAGAYIGALYASGMSPSAILDFVQESSLWKLFQIGLPLDGLAKLTYAQERLEQVIPADDFADLQKRLFVAISNLNEGKVEMRHEGRLISTVMASCAIPLIFKPIEIDGNIYVDGGLLSNLPAQPLRDCCEVVLGVNVMSSVSVSVKQVQSLMGIAIRSFELSIYANTAPSKAMCDLVIEPRGLRSYHIFRFGSFREIYDIGYRATLEQMPRITAMLDLLRESPN